MDAPALLREAVRRRYGADVGGSEEVIVHVSGDANGCAGGNANGHGSTKRVDTENANASEKGSGGAGGQQTQQRQQKVGAAGGTTAASAAVPPAESVLVLRTELYEEVQRARIAKPVAVRPVCVVKGAKDSRDLLPIAAVVRVKKGRADGVDGGRDRENEGREEQDGEWEGDAENVADAVERAASGTKSALGCAVLEGAVAGMHTRSGAGMVYWENGAVFVRVTGVEEAEGVNSVMVEVSCVFGSLGKPSIGEGVLAWLDVVSVDRGLVRRRYEVGVLRAVMLVCNREIAAGSKEVPRLWKGFQKWRDDNLVGRLMNDSYGVLGNGGCGMVKSARMNGRPVALKYWNGRHAGGGKLLDREIQLYCGLAGRGIDAAVPDLVAVGWDAWVGVVLVTRAVGLPVRLDGGRLTVGASAVRVLDVARIEEGALSALARLHTGGVAHGDVGLRNLRAQRGHDGDWRVWWVDLGMASYNPSPATAAAEIRRCARVFDAVHRQYWPFCAKRPEIKV